MGIFKDCPSGLGLWAQLNDDVKREVGGWPEFIGVVLLCGCLVVAIMSSGCRAEAEFHPVKKSAISAGK